MQRAKHVLFLTARMDTPKSWLCARTDLAEAGILATRDHVVFTGAAHVKGRYARIALASGACVRIPHGLWTTMAMRWQACSPACRT